MWIKSKGLMFFLRKFRKEREKIIRIVKIRIIKLKNRIFYNPNNQNNKGKHVLIDTVSLFILRTLLWPKNFIDIFIKNFLS
jgi:hypothetical protein